MYPGCGSRRRPATTRLRRRPHLRPPIATGLIDYRRPTSCAGQGRAATPAISGLAAGARPACPQVTFRRRFRLVPCAGPGQCPRPRRLVAPDRARGGMGRRHTHRIPRPIRCHAPPRAPGPLYRCGVARAAGGGDQPHDLKCGRSGICRGDRERGRRSARSAAGPARRAVGPTGCAPTAPRRSASGPHAGARRAAFRGASRPQTRSSGR